MNLELPQVTSGVAVHFKLTDVGREREKKKRDRVDCTIFQEGAGVDAQAKYIYFAFIPTIFI